MKRKYASLLWVLIFWPSPSFGQVPDLLNQAKKEGEVVLYSTITVSDFEPFNRAAKEKYPFLNVRHVYLSSARQVARVMQEHRAGRIQADVLGNSLEPILYLKQQNVLSTYRSPERQNLIQAAYDAEGDWWGITTDLLVTAFNPKVISSAAVPKNYEEYLKPQFKGQMALNRELRTRLQEWSRSTERSKGWPT